MALWTEQQRQTRNRRRAVRIERLGRRWRFYTRKYGAWQECGYETFREIKQDFVQIIRDCGSEGLSDGPIRKAVRR